MPFSIADLLSVAVLSLDVDVMKEKPTATLFLTINPTISAEVYSLSGTKTTCSVILVEKTNWMISNKNTLICPRSVGGLIAQYIFLKTRNLELAYQVSDYDPILEKKFPSQDVKNGVLLQKALFLVSEGTVVQNKIPKISFDKPVSIVNPNNFFGLFKNFPSSNETAEIQPTILPVLLASKDMNDAKAKASLLFPHMPDALERIAGAVNARVKTEDELKAFIQSSIDVLEFGPWKDRVDELRQVFGYRPSGGGINDNQKIYLNILLDASPKLVNAANVILKNVTRIPADIKTEITNKGSFPRASDVNEAVQVLRPLL